MDPIPLRHNRAAVALGLALHPALICVPTLAMILSDLPVVVALKWTALVAGVVTLPGLATIVLLQWRSRYVYQRHNRHIVYVVIGVSVMVSLALLLMQDGPEVLVACLATLAVWLPVQALINARWTKISAHTAVMTGCVLSLWWLGRLDTLLLQLLGPSLIGLTAWSRIVTRHHTPLQVALGALVAAGSVVLVFALLVDQR